MSILSDSPYLSQEPNKPVTQRDLKPPKGYRGVTPRVCACCHFAKWETYEDSYGIEHDTGILSCTRPNGPSFEGGDMNQWFYTCDRWQEENGGDK